MEKLLHYVWKHKMFPARPLLTTTGESVEVIDAGLPNTNAGPDFFNAKVRIGGTMWVGNIEIREFGIRNIKKVEVVVYSPYVPVMVPAYSRRNNMQQVPSIDSL